MPLSFNCKLVLIACGAAVALAARAQAGVSASQATKLPSLEFEVAAIKPHASSGTMNGGWRFTTDSFSVTNLTLKTMIFYAYNLRSGEQLEGLPKWARTDAWDIQAKLDADAVQQVHKLDREQHADENRLMVQNLLAERFQLRIHHKARDLPVYDLTLAKGGSKLKPAAASDKASGWNWRDGSFEGTDVGPDALAYSLSSSDEVGRVVVDKTGLSGKYDIKLKWTPEGKQETADSGPSLFTALQEQLGLKLVSTKGPVDTLVVDHVEKPTPN